MEMTGFCMNSRRWLEFMDASGKYPSTCPYEANCDRCGYFKDKKETKYLIRKRKLIHEAFKLLNDYILEYGLIK